CSTARVRLLLHICRTVSRFALLLAGSLAFWMADRHVSITADVGRSLRIWNCTASASALMISGSIFSHYGTSGGAVCPGAVGSARADMHAIAIESLFRLARYLCCRSVTRKARYSRSVPPETAPAACAMVADA